jgi:hypothetical protein
MTNHEPFDDDTRERRRDGAEQHGERQRHTALGRDDGDIRPAHDELAVREIDHAHHAEDHRETERREHQIGEVVAELIHERIENRQSGHACSTFERTTRAATGGARKRTAGQDFLGRLDGVYWR